MTTPTFRPIDLDRDCTTVSELTAEAFPFLMQDAATARHNEVKSGPAARRMSLVAELDGQVVAFGSTSLDTESSKPGKTGIRMVVAKAHRRTGIGSGLLEQFKPHWNDIGSSVVEGRVTSDEGLAFAQHHGFSQGRTERISHVSLAVIPEAVPAPEGIELKSLSELPDARALYEIDSAVIADVPSDDPFAPVSFKEWSRIYMDDPRLDAEATVLAFDGDTAVAVAWLDRVEDRVWSGLTGTLRQYRGQGLAKVVKTAALHRARERGATDAYTNNDATNAGMLAVNNWLGYKLHVEQFSVVRELN